MYCFDEPTNHLDAESVLWLEHLAQYSGTVIAVTHDRYFLDNVAGWILELIEEKVFRGRELFFLVRPKNRAVWH
jgi:ATPase subunit of ABC transporter with duplicated ATPase domains